MHRYAQASLVVALARRAATYTLARQELPRVEHHKLPLTIRNKTT